MTAADKKGNSKVINFNLDDVTQNISNGLKALNKIESNPDKVKIKPGTPIGGIDKAYTLIYAGIDETGIPRYNLNISGVDPNRTTGITAEDVRKFTKSEIIDTYLNDIYGE